MSGSDGVVVQARDLSVGHGRRIVLREVDLCVRRGECWFLLGENGAGKSTLLHTLIGILPPCAGRIEHGPGHGRANTGFVPQQCEIAPGLPSTVAEFVALGTVGLEVSAAERRDRTSEALTTVDLASAARRDVSSLSGGQRQRAMVARALVRRPSLLAVDEPMNNLDGASQLRLLELFDRARAERGLTILCVSHDPNLAARSATHVARVGEGSVVGGTVAEVLR